MPLEKAEAITIRLTDFSETSQIGWFYTREFGLISALAKGAKRPRNSFEGRLDLLCHSQIVFVRKRRSTLHTLTECKLLDRFRGLRAGVGRLYAALYAAELVREMTPAEESHPEVFDLLLWVVRALSQDEDVEQTVLVFEVRLLALVGYAPRLDVCVACGAVSEERGATRYSTLLGGVLCPRCLERDPKSRGVPRGALNVLERLAGGSVTRTATLKLPDGMVTVLRKIMKATFAHVLGREPRLMRYV
ncbi:DNA repair protein RecO [bacterium]|nr:DNA repair protein RecO [bacterium]